MSYQIEPNRSQQALPIGSYDSLVKMDHPVRFIWNCISALNMNEIGFPDSSLRDGRPNYSPRMMLAVLIYSFFSGVHSFREMEIACTERTPFLWLTGDANPDHNSFWRFAKNHQEQLHQAFAQIVRMAVEANCVDFVLHAIDGTKIAAACSSSKIWDKSKLEKMLARLEKAYTEQVKKLQEEYENSVETCPIPPELLALAEKVEQYKHRLEQVNSEGTKRLNPREPEARPVKCGSQILQGFNAQIGVDSKEWIIVSELLTNEANDLNQLTAVLDQVKENTGRNAEESLADTGYANSQELAKAAEKAYQVLVNLKDEEEAQAVDPFHHSKFVVDLENLTCVCPLGCQLAYQGLEWSAHKTYKNFVFQCRRYRDCVERLACSHAVDGRKIKIGEYSWAMDAQREKQKDPLKKALLKQRGRIVELVFAVIKHVLGIRRFRWWGMGSAASQWSLLTMTCNVKRLYEIWRAGRIRWDASGGCLKLQPTI